MAQIWQCSPHSTVFAETNASWILHVLRLCSYFPKPSALKFPRVSCPPRVQVSTEITSKHWNTGSPSTSGPITDRACHLLTFTHTMYSLCQWLKQLLYLWSQYSPLLQNTVPVLFFQTPSLCQTSPSVSVFTLFPTLSPPFPEYFLSFCSHYTLMLPSHFFSNSLLNPLSFVPSHSFSILDHSCQSRYCLHTYKHSSSLS